MNSKIYFFVLALASASVLAACGDIERGQPTPVKKEVTTGGGDTGGDDTGGDDTGGDDTGGDDTGGDTGGNGGLSFAADAHPILMDKCSGCHTATNGTAYKLTGDAATDLPVVKALVDLAAPADSTLLKHATKEVAHGGGAVITNTSAEYTTLLQWITDGAQP